MRRVVGRPAMLRIHIGEPVSEIATISLEGRVIGPWVETLRQACDAVLSHGTGLVLDLSDVAFVGREGLELLRSLRDRQVVLRNCSPFVGEQLKG
jgi:anti-anti-sigma regulatory factor